MHERKLGCELPAPLALSFIGDAQHSLYVRRMLVGRGLSKSGDLSSLSLSYVTCEAQARMFSRIEHLLLEDEREVFRRASNSGHLNRPRHASARDYRTATGFEAVIGMLSWIGDDERLNMLLDIAHADGDITDNKKTEATNDGGTE